MAKKTKTSANAMTMKRLRELGFDYQNVETRLGPFIRKDFADAIDIIAWNEHGQIGIQTCVGSSHAARREKMLASLRLRRWMEQSKSRVEIWSWSKCGGRDERKVWTLRREQVTADEFFTA